MKRLRQCASCRDYFHDIVEMKLTQISLDLDAARKVNYKPLCLACAHEKLTRWLALLAEAKGRA